MVVLITGARSGFGLLTAVEAARRGHVVYAGLRDLASADEKLVPLSEGLDVRPVQLDVTRASEREGVVARISEIHGGVDALINNAGIALGGFLEQIDEDELREVFEVNVFGAWALTKAVLPSMRRAGSGRVVMVSSMSGRYAWPAAGAYAGSKFALEGLCEAWRQELLPFGIRLTLVEPGPYRTDIFSRNRRIARRAEDPDGPYAAMAARVEGMARRFERMGGDPQDVAVRICDLLETRRSRLRYPTGTSAWIREVALGLAPHWAVERLYQKLLGS